MAPKVTPWRISTAFGIFDSRLNNCLNNHLNNRRDNSRKLSHSASACLWPAEHLSTPHHRAKKAMRQCMVHIQNSMQGIASRVACLQPAPMHLTLHPPSSSRGSATTILQHTGTPCLPSFMAVAGPCRMV